MKKSQAAKKILFITAGIIIAFLIIFNNHLLFRVESILLKKHIAALAPAYHNNRFPEKIHFCTRFPYSKVWAHRVNTVERFLFLADAFQGFEMDIVFDENSKFLDVRHPPAGTLKLSFEQYLQVAQSKGKFFWLDVKNITNGNVSPILECLSDLDEKYQIRERIIIESDNIPALSKISGAGYFTSYYYDPGSYRVFMSSGNERSRDSLLNMIDAVSQDVLIYDTLLKKFPSKPRLTRALSVKNYVSDSVFTALDNDKGLLVYLVNIKSPRYR